MPLVSHQDILNAFMKISETRKNKSPGQPDPREGERDCTACMRSGLWYRDARTCWGPYLESPAWTGTVLIALNVLSYLIFTIALSDSYSFCHLVMTN